MHRVVSFLRIDFIQHQRRSMPSDGSMSDANSQYTQPLRRTRESVGVRRWHAQIPGIIGRSRYRGMMLHQGDIVPRHRREAERGRERHIERYRVKGRERCRYRLGHEVVPFGNGGRRSRFLLLSVDPHHRWRNSTRLWMLRRNETKMLYVKAGIDQKSKQKRQNQLLEILL